MVIMEVINNIEWVVIVNSSWMQLAPLTFPTPYCGSNTDDAAQLSCWCLVGFEDVGQMSSAPESTRWFKYDRDYLCVNKSQFVPVIFEPPCTSDSACWRVNLVCSNFRYPSLLRKHVRLHFMTPDRRWVWPCTLRATLRVEWPRFFPHPWPVRGRVRMLTGLCMGWAHIGIWKRAVSDVWGWRLHVFTIFPMQCLSAVIVRVWQR